MVLLVMTGFGISYSLGLDQWFIAAVPEEQRGRALTLQGAGLMTAQGLSMAAAGAVGELMPVHRAGRHDGRHGNAVLAACGPRGVAGPAHAPGTIDRRGLVVPESRTVTVRFSCTI
jgi:hypothetical protein